ncbi:hypothetical protein EZV62_022447 [Acer yangbiense]|uniref:Uncharacterized protein n=1 Tax=Acer yangbiense TaxID=1000413 RepID=A0A5C7H8D6_9ROSI|nr:hypothetical protein EZV62_022447 [Acer yangbiense]
MVKKVIPEKKEGGSDKKTSMNKVSKPKIGRMAWINYFALECKKKDDNGKSNVIYSYNNHEVKLEKHGIRYHTKRRPNFENRMWVKLQPQMCQLSNLSIALTTSPTTLTSPQRLKKSLAQEIMLAIKIKP